ncbi:hypothetical protein BpHYR1_051564 [Brachionus plicatilis]|uniref:Uncharacterized protein n=1 Tax=Brachionus plicatilis TaxID=10195 RepID=A0A3M7RMG9_BRAPC|nr:hypothetical protein BpHYR1_051564 [Brachionus plicatilis]
MIEKAAEGSSLNPFTVTNTLRIKNLKKNEIASKKSRDPWEVQNCLKNFFTSFLMRFKNLIALDPNSSQIKLSNVIKKEVTLQSTDHWNGAILSG